MQYLRMAHFLLPRNSAGYGNRKVQVWNAITGELLHTIMAAQDWMIDEVEFAPSGNQALVAQSDGSAFLLNCEAGEKIQNLSLVTYPAFLRFVANDNWVLSADNQNFVSIWDMTEEKKLCFITYQSGSFPARDFSQDGLRSVYGGDEGQVIIWDTLTGDVVTDIKGYSKKITITLFSPDGKLLFVKCNDGTAKFWNTATGEEIGSITDKAGTILCADYSPDGKLLLTGNDLGLCHIWKLDKLYNSAVHSWDLY